MQIRCKVSNDVPVSVYSDPVTLHVMQAPVIVTDPTDQSVTSGDPVTFSITATGATKYQWQCSSNGGITWVNLTNGSFWKGNKTDTLTFTTMDHYDGYLFRCLAINDAGTTASAFSEQPEIHLNKIKHFAPFSALCRKRVPPSSGFI
jgi:hypothetical protein